MQSSNVWDISDVQMGKSRQQQNLKVMDWNITQDRWSKQIVTPA